MERNKFMDFYETPIMEIIKLDTEDIVTTSNGKETEEIEICKVNN